MRRTGRVSHVRGRWSDVLEPHRRGARRGRGTRRVRIRRSIAAYSVRYGSLRSAVVNSRAFVRFKDSTRNSTSTSALLGRSRTPLASRNILIGSHLLDLNPLVISASAVWVGFDQYERAVVICEAAIRFAVGVLVELGARQRAILVDFPLVRFAIAVAVLFRSNQRATARRRVEGLRRIVMLPPIDLVLVAGRRDLNAIHFAVASGVCPRVGLSVLIAREADLQQRPIVPVVLPTIHLPIFVEIDARPERLRAVHICPGVDDAVLVAVVGELSQLPARLVVGRQRRLLDPVAVWIVAGRGKRRGH